MSVESATYIGDLNSNLPAAGDFKAEGDDHLRLVKAATKASFPNIAGAVNATVADMAARVFDNPTWGTNWFVGAQAVRGVDGVVTLNLSATSGGGWGVTVATLSAGYRPLQTRIVEGVLGVAPGSPRLCTVQIDTAGVISLLRYSDGSAIFTGGASAVFWTSATFPTR